MILLKNIRLEKDDFQALRKKVGKILKLNNDFKMEIFRKSIDARKGIAFNYQVLVDVEINDERLSKIKDASIYEHREYRIEPPYRKKSVIIVGFGPAGIFSAYILAKYGYKPIVLERGKAVDKRKEDVDYFFKTGNLNINSNIQFGEGGAGTFSDGKLTARSKDDRQREVLKIFVENGAPREILYDQKPHIGTDILIDVIRNMREYIVNEGGKVYFETKMIDFEAENGEVTEVITNRGIFKADEYIIALGHSARDTFEMLSSKLDMENKPFAVGFRIEHPQTMVNLSQYKICDNSLPQASYALTHQVKQSKMGVYTFCMCPGGYVVNASSEENRLCVNGMSYYKRDGENANSAIICTVDESIYGNNVLDGIRFQRKIEEKAFELAGGNYFAPVQRIDDFLENRCTDNLGEVIPTIKPGYKFANLRNIYPEKITTSIAEAIVAMNRKLKGFSMNDGILTGVETRSSSPVRILRDENLHALRYNNLYPIGEGAGYAGGIVSSAIDGIKAAEKVIRG